MTSRVILVLTFVWALGAVLSIHLLRFPGSVPDFRESNQGGILLDVSPSFEVDATYERLGRYGEAGRENYSRRNVTVDLVLPLSLLPFLLLFMHRAVRDLPSAALRASLLAIPLAYVAFDLIENGLVLTLLRNYPARMNLVATVLPYVTVVKRVASILALIVPGVSLALLSWRRHRALPQIG